MEVMNHIVARVILLLLAMLPYVCQRGQLTSSTGRYYECGVHTGLRGQAREAQWKS